MQFATKPALALAMICSALDAGATACWAAGDEVYGNDPGLRAGLQQRGLGYVLAVSRDLRIPTNAGSVRADAVARGLPPHSWQRLSAGLPFRKNKSPSLLAAPHILWPVTPHRVVALTNEPSGEKAIIRLATPSERGLVRDAIEQGRERWIFASPEQKDRLPKTKKFGRRRQVRMRCSQWTPRGRYVEPPGCCVEQADGFSAGPDVALCDQGLHVNAPAMWEYV